MARECEIKEILGHNTISINDYNLMDAMQKSILIEQNYVIIRMLNDLLRNNPMMGVRQNNFCGLATLLNCQTGLIL